AGGGEVGRRCAPIGSVVGIAFAWLGASTDDDQISKWVPFPLRRSQTGIGPSSMSHMGRLVHGPSPTAISVPTIGWMHQPPSIHTRAHGSLPSDPSSATSHVAPGPTVDLRRGSRKTSCPPDLQSSPRLGVMARSR